jgi:signal transduction histidine kinase
LAIVLQGIEFLENNLSRIGDKNQKVIRNIKKSIDRADNIITELLKFSRTPNLEFTYMGLYDLMRDALSLVENRMRLGRVEAIKNFPGEDIQILADRSLLEQVFFNLYGNAIDAMPEGGRLMLNVKPHMQKVIIEISDTGKGIAPDQLPNIFDPFFTTKEIGQGVGLGLSIVRLILEKHNGTIEAESKMGKGTKFTIKLPKKTEGRKSGDKM